MLVVAAAIAKIGAAGETGKFGVDREDVGGLFAVNFYFNFVGLVWDDAGDVVGFGIFEGEDAFGRDDVVTAFGEVEGFREVKFSVDGLAGGNWLEVILS